MLHVDQGRRVCRAASHAATKRLAGTRDDNLPLSADWNTGRPVTGVSISSNAISKAGAGILRLGYLPAAGYSAETPVRTLPSIEVLALLSERELDVVRGSVFAVDS